MSTASLAADVYEYRRVVKNRPGDLPCVLVSIGPAGHEPVQPVMWTGVLGEGERTTGPTGQNDRRSGSLHRALGLTDPAST